jgi:hypothetical protein
MFCKSILSLFMTNNTEITREKYIKSPLNYIAGQVKRIKIVGFQGIHQTLKPIFACVSLVFYYFVYTSILREFFVFGVSCFDKTNFIWINRFLKV